jgi:hypothetical protein
MGLHQWTPGWPTAVLDDLQAVLERFDKAVAPGAGLCRVLSG